MSTVAEQSAMKADLVLEGGGVKGIALVGTVSVLREAGYTFPRVAGTSAGAIVGALVASGMPAEQMLAVMRATDCSKFQDGTILDRLGPLGQGASLLFQNGTYEGNSRKAYLGDLLPDEVETFAGLRLPDDPYSDLDPSQRFRLVMASDVSQHKLVRLPWDFEAFYDWDPSTESVIDAARASLSIPFFLQPAHVDYRIDSEKRRSVVVDGGMLLNSPVQILDRTDGRPARWPTFGIELSSRPTDHPRPSPIHGPPEPDVRDAGHPARLGRLLPHRRPRRVRPAIFVDTFGICAASFDLSPAHQDRLNQSGRTAAEKFLKSWDCTNYTRTHPPDRRRQTMTETGPDACQRHRRRKAKAGQSSPTRTGRSH